MKVVIFGASGRVGKLLVQEALYRGHEVTAVLMRKGEMLFPDSVHVVEADVHDAAAVEAAVAGKDIVLSALGSWGTKEQDILVSAMRCIVPAMKKNNIRRIVSLTGADTRHAGDKRSISSCFMEYVLKFIAPQVYEDGQEHIRVLSESELDWTVIRSPRMKEGLVKKYKLDIKSTQAWHNISRLTIVRAMLDQLESDRFFQAAPIIKEL